MDTGSPTARSRFSTLMVPATTGGRWCLALFTIGALGFIAMVVSVGTGQEGGETFTDNWWISGPAVVAALGVVGAVAPGLFAILRRRERAAPVLLATATGVIVILFLIGEVVSPH